MPVLGDEELSAERGSLDALCPSTPSAGRSESGICGFGVGAHSCEPRWWLVYPRKGHVPHLSGVMDTQGGPQGSHLRKRTGTVPLAGMGQTPLVCVGAAQSCACGKHANDGTMIAREKVGG